MDIAKDIREWRRSIRTFSGSNLTKMLCYAYNWSSPLATRRLVRQIAGSHANCYVEVIDGEFAPKMVGRSYYWTTLSETLARMLGLTAAPVSAAA